MSPHTRLILRGLCGGLAGTLAMDLTAITGRLLGALSGLHPKYIMRWFGHVLHGHPWTGDIRVAAADVAVPLPAMILMHYTIGATLGVLYVVLLQRFRWPAGPATGLAWGMLTNALPWLFMYPAMGFGFFGLNGPPEALLLRTSCVNHLAFGLGLGAVVARILR